MMDDLISRKAAINNIKNGFHWETVNGITAQAVLKQVIHDIEIMPSVKPEIIRCKDCKWWGYEDETGDVRVCHAAKHGYISSHWEITIRRTYRGDFYCADAERRGEQDGKNT